MNNNLAPYIEHTLLKPDAVRADIQTLCEEAIRYNFHAVCVNSCHIVQAGHLLLEHPVKVVSVAGFPLGAADGDVKRFETEAAIDLGAEEIDVVLNIGRLKDGDDAYVLRELRDIVEVAQSFPVKVILETGLLTEKEKWRACELAKASGAQFVKTSTGFNAGGATVEDVRLLRQAVGETMGVKASGGIRDAAFAQSLIEAGANRLGTSSGVAIVSEFGGEGESLVY